MRIRGYCLKKLGYCLFPSLFCCYSAVLINQLVGQQLLMYYCGLSFHVLCKSFQVFIYEQCHCGRWKYLEKYWNVLLYMGKHDWGSCLHKKCIYLTCLLTVLVNEHIFSGSVVAKVSWLNHYFGTDMSFLCLIFFLSGIIVACSFWLLYELWCSGVNTSLYHHL